MPPKRCAYLEMAENDAWFENEKRWIPAFESHGWTVTAVKWLHEAVNWDNFDAVYIGYPWDYPEYPQQFLQCLRRIDQSRAVLVNDLALVEWTLDKRYLRTMESNGVPIVPTRWLEALSISAITDCFSAFGSDELIVKPVVGNNAGGVLRLAPEHATSRIQAAGNLLAEQSVMVQPYMAEIESDGECSIYFFGGVFSHAVRKVPAKGDFRVQEQFGADIRAVTPSSDLVEAAACAVQNVDPAPVYARVDMIRSSTGENLLMELELVEPSLYLGFDPDAPHRFAKAFDQHITRKKAEAG